MKLFAKKIFNNIEEVYKDMMNKKNDYYNHKIDKYVISYEIQDDEHIIVKSNIGRTRVVHNNKRNRKKLDQVIVKSKVDIANKIDIYEKESNERLFMLLFNMILLSLSGMSVVISLFTGNYYLMLFSLFVFSLIITLATTITYNYYFLVKEIKSLKNITGYKEDVEINLPKLKIENFFKTNKNNTSKI